MIEPVWNEDLVCNWFGLLVPGPGHVAILVKPLNCTDMTGAIKVAKAAMPEVSTVTVAAGGSGEIDVAYLLRDGEWRAVEPPRGAILREALAFVPAYEGSTHER